jgi:hypothetical protein
MYSIGKLFFYIFIIKIFNNNLTISQNILLFCIIMCILISPNQIIIFTHNYNKNINNYYNEFFIS